MARKHSGGSRRSKAHRAPAFRATCKGCGTITVLQMRPPPGIDLYCVACNAADKNKRMSSQSPG